MRLHFGHQRVGDPPAHLDCVVDVLLALDDVPHVDVGPRLKRKFMSCSHCQELGKLADLASDWLLNLVQPIRSRLTC